MPKLMFAVMARRCYRLCDERGHFLTLPLTRPELEALIAQRYAAHAAVLLPAMDVARTRWTSVLYGAHGPHDPWRGEMAELRSRAEPVSVQARMCFRLCHLDGVFVQEPVMTQAELFEYIRRRGKEVDDNALLKAISVAKTTGSSLSPQRKKSFDEGWGDEGTAAVTRAIPSPPAAKPWWKRVFPFFSRTPA